MKKSGDADNKNQMNEFTCIHSFIHSFIHLQSAHCTLYTVHWWSIRIMNVQRSSHNAIYTAHCTLYIVQGSPLRFTGINKNRRLFSTHLFDAARRMRHETRGSFFPCFHKYGKLFEFRIPTILIGSRRRLVRCTYNFNSVLSIEYHIIKRTYI